MALTQGSKIVATDIATIKANLKAELKRRGGQGSVYGYGENAHDYTTAPTAGGKVLTEHLNKLLTLTKTIDGTTVSSVGAGDEILATTVGGVATRVNNLAAINKYSSNSGCSASCTGLCSTSCFGSCKSNCDSVCDGGCSANCTSSCIGGAQGTNSTNGSYNADSTGCNVCGGTCCSVPILVVDL